MAGVRIKWSFPLGTTTPWCSQYHGRDCFVRGRLLGLPPSLHLATSRVSGFSRRMGECPSRHEEPIVPNPGTPIWSPLSQPGTMELMMQSPSKEETSTPSRFYSYWHLELLNVLSKRLDNLEDLTSAQNASPSSTPPLPPHLDIRPPNNHHHHKTSQESHPLLPTILPVPSLQRSRRKRPRRSQRQVPGTSSSTPHPQSKP